MFHKSMEDFKRHLKMGEAFRGNNSDAANSALGQMAEALADGKDSTTYNSPTYVPPKTLDGISVSFFNQKIKNAREYAECVHNDQKYGEHPYVKHLADVYRVFLEFTIQPVYEKTGSSNFNSSGIIDKFQDVAAAIWLHDVLEDTSSTKEELEDYFGTEVAELVWAVTGVGKDRQERLDSIEEKLTTKPDALIIKLCDRIANTRASQADYYGEPTSLQEGSSDKKKAKFLMYVEEYHKFKAALSYGEYSDIGFVKNMWKELDNITKV